MAVDPAAAKEIAAVADSTVEVRAETNKEEDAHVDEVEIGAAAEEDEGPK